MTRVSSPSLPKMSNRRQILDLINCVMRKIKTSGGYEQRFILLDNVQILTDILNEVTTFETKLLMDMDVD